MLGSSMNDLVNGMMRSVMWLQIIRKERSVGVKPSVPTIYEVRLLIVPAFQRCGISRSVFSWARCALSACTSAYRVRTLPTPCKL